MRFRDTKNAKQKVGGGDDDCKRDETKSVQRQQIRTVKWEGTDVMQSNSAIQIGRAGQGTDMDSGILRYVG